MLLLILLVLLALIFLGAGFAVHLLWIGLIVCAILLVVRLAVGSGV